MYTLINAGKASMFELESCYTLDAALKLYALHEMTLDIQYASAKEAEGGGGHR